jgi:hypothetical protein
MIRRLFTIVSALSLPLCMATAVLWVRSYSKVDTVTFEPSDHSPSGGWPRIHAVSSRGQLWFVRVHVGEPPERALFWYSGDVEQTLMFTACLLPQQFNPTNPTSIVGIRHVTGALQTSDAALIVIFGSPFTFWAGQWMFRRSLRQRGFCSECGYDLRASKNRCPKCGTPIPLKSEATT